MFSAAFRFCRVGFLLLVAGVIAAPAQTPTRSVPSRPAAAPPRPPAALAVRKFGKLEYVKLSDVAAQLGLKFTRFDRGRRVTLTGPGASAELEKDTRDITVNGLRVLLGDSTQEANGDLYISRVDHERCLTPLLKPGFGISGHNVPGAKVVVLDPGHGGRDNGTSTNEKVFALDVAKRAKKLLDAAGYRTVLTRNSDTYLSLPERPAIARANDADLFVSIHFNALQRDRKTSGVEVYTFPPQHQRSTEAWSPGERNDTETNDEPVHQFDHWNAALAHAIHRRFVVDLKAFDRGKKLMHLGVLRSLNCPGVLVECGFLTSEVEAKKIATAAYRDKLAQTIVNGIRDYTAAVEAARRKT